MKFQRIAAVLALSATLGSGIADRQLYGHVVAVHGNVLTLRLRDGSETKVDIAQARAERHTGVLPVGGAVVVNGQRDAEGVFHAVSIGHASPNSRNWSPDQ